MKLSKKFIDMQFKPTERKSVNMGRMSLSDMRKEYSKQSKVANKRISSIEKSGLYSPAVSGIRDKGIDRFGLKNQNIDMNDPNAIRTAYRELMNFLGSTTSTKTGIRATLNKIIKNFGLTFNGDYNEFSTKTKEIFDLYEDLNELARQGKLKSSNKYELVKDIETLFDDGTITPNMSPSEVARYLNQLYENRAKRNIARQRTLNFHWNV